MCAMNQQALHLPNPQDWLSVDQAAALIGVDRSTIYDLIRREKLGDFTIGSLRVLWRPEVDAYATAYRIVKGGQ